MTGLLTSQQAQNEGSVLPLSISAGLELLISPDRREQTQNTSIHPSLDFDGDKTINQD